MFQTFKKLSNNTLLRYVFIGGLSFLIEIAAIYTLINLFKVGSLPAVAISFWIGLVASFLLQKFLAFRDKRSSAKHILKQSIAYGILIMINYVFTLGFVAVFEAVLGIFIARAVSLIITTGWNFIAYSKIIFNNRGN